MAAKVGSSLLAQKLRGRADKAIQSHATDETDYGFQRIPGGITNGIARLVECTFGEFKPGTANAGQPYFRAAGVVVEPYSIQTSQGEVVVQGMQTSIIVSVCETKKGDGSVVSLEENVDRVMNEMRKLGADTSEMGSAEDLEETAAALKEAGPYFKFTTSESKPRPGTQDQPRVWENWYGVKGLENYTPPENDEVQDDTDPVPPSIKNGKAGPAAKVKPTKKQPEPEPEDDGGYTDSGDIDSLLERANEGDGDAQTQLVELAVANGVDRDAAESADTWDDLAEMIRNGGADSEVESDEEPEDESPEVGNVYKYKPQVKGPGGKMVQAKKAVECEVKSVNKGKKTVVLTNLVDGKTTYKEVSWGLLDA